MKENTKENTKEIIELGYGERKTTSIYINPHIFKTFYKHCRSQGSRSCGILEAFMVAYVSGTSKVPGSPLPVVNVNLSINRIVRRHQRAAKEESVPIVESGDFDECALCPGLPVVYLGINEPHQRSMRYLCEDHFYEHLEGYKDIFWKEIRKFTWSHKWKT